MCVEFNFCHLSREHKSKWVTKFKVVKKNVFINICLDKAMHFLRFFKIFIHILMFLKRLMMFYRYTKFRNLPITNAQGNTSQNRETTIIDIQWAKTDHTVIVNGFIEP